MPDPSVPSIRVFNQHPREGSVIVQDAVSAVSGWIVIRERRDGQPGRVVGYTPVRAGVNRWVRIPIEVDAPRYLYAALHVDSGRTGSLELPAPDEPVTAGPAGEPVLEQFILQERLGWFEDP